MNKIRIVFILLSALLFSACNTIKKTAGPIKPSTVNPSFWEYKNEPVLLLGASSDDNLFQWPQELLLPHLDSMKTAGANYVRNTMSDRLYRGFELYPFKKLESGKYDLDQWNDQYWERFNFFLEETAKRDIIVQIEVWDRFDYSQKYWLPHPYNPQNNINYSFEESGLASEYPNHPGHNKQPFFFTTPGQQNNEILLGYQKRFVEKMLNYSLKFNHIIYCMDNETSGEEKWAVFWSDFISSKAEESGKKIFVTEMWDNWNLKSEQHKRTFDHPERYAFCDVSQNNQQKGQIHWDNFQWVRNYIGASPRPLNTVKTYGADGGVHGNTKDGLERWWRHLIGGVASARFHRPPAGLGLSELSIASVKVAREIESVVNFWELTPGNELLSEREKNEAYLTSKPGEVYVIFFTDGGEVELDLTGENADFKLKWINIRNATSLSDQKISGGEKIKIIAPGKMEWIAVITSK
jgi:hypothetical protein